MTRFVQQSLLAAALAAVLGVASAADEPAKKPATPAIAPAKDAKPPVAIDKNKISTMVGMDIGRGLTQIKDDIDIKVVEQALEQTLKGEKTSLTQEEALQVRQAYMQQMQAKRVADQKAAAEKNKSEGEAFLAKNKSKSGVKTTASGLQYEVEKLKNQIQSTEAECDKLRHEVGSYRGETERHVKEREDIAAALGRAMNEALARLRGETA